MKRVQVIELLRTIKGSAFKFLSLILFISLGLSTYLGIRFAGQSMRDTGGEYYRESYYNHIQVSFFYGLRQEDLEQIADIEYISRVEGGYSTTGFLELADEERLIMVQNVTEQINQASLLDGRLPINENEVVIEASMRDEDMIQIGETIAIDSINADGSSILKQSEFEVVGIVRHPEYISNYEYGRRGTSSKGNGNCLNFVLVDSSSFDQEKLDETYSSVYIWSDWIDEAEPFSEEYEERCQVVINDITSLAKRRAESRHDDMLVEYSNARAQTVGSMETGEMANNIEKSEMSLEEPLKAEWIVVGREANANYVMFKSSIQTIRNLSMSFAFVYILVAAMVCYSTMSRMINENKIYIGTQKALGYRGFEILSKYLIYAILCVLLGAYGGVISAVYLVEDLTLNSYLPMYIFSEYPNVYEINDIIIVLLAAILLVVVATVLACRKLISTPTVRLLNYSDMEEKKEMALERSNWWKRRSLYSRSMMRNLIHDHQYVITTIIGVTGCTALMIIGFTLKFAVEDVIGKQFENIARFDMGIVVSGTDKDDVQPFYEYLDRNDSLKYTGVKSEMVILRVNKQDYMNAGMLVSEMDNLEEYFYMADLRSEKNISIPSRGTVVNNHLANYYNVKKGDYIEIVDIYGNSHPIEVVGFFENYVNHYIIMSDDYYKDVFQEDNVVNTIYVNIKGDDNSAIKNDVEEIEKFIAFTDKEMGIEVFEAIAASINSLIQLLIFLSGVMALVVIMNLAAMYIREKERILAIMRINGFTLKETKRYIANNNNIVIAIGLIFGVILGIVLGYFVVQAIENDTTCFVEVPSIKACILGVCFSSSFAFIVNWIARRKINHLPLNKVSALD